MGFAETGATIKEEGIVAGAGGFDNVFGGGDCEFIITTDDEVIKSVFIVKAVVVGFGGSF